MCLQPIIDRKLSTLYDKYENVSLDEFDNCDYVHSITDVKCADLVIYAVKYPRYWFEEEPTY